jgi:hypothetical protein
MLTGWNDQLKPAKDGKYSLFFQLGPDRDKVAIVTED